MRSDIQLREATPLDSIELNQFFSSIPLQGFLDIKIHRQVDFFSLFHRLGQKYKTYILEKNKSDFKKPELLGTASFLFQNRICNLQKQKIAFGCDLRIAPQRKAILSWGQFFLPQIENLFQIENIDHIITSLNLTESQVINAFIRPKITRTDRPVYELIQKYNLVTIHGFYPTQYPMNKNILVSRLQAGNQADKDNLMIFIKRKLKNLEMVSEDMLLDLNASIHKSLLYSWNQFLVAKSTTGEIIGCAHPVSSTLLQDYFPQKYNQQAHNFRQFLKFSSLLRFGRNLTKPFSRTNKEQTLNFKMLHYLFFDHPDVMNTLIKNSFDQCQSNEFLVYAYQPENFQSRPPKGSIHAEIPYGIYEIKSPNQKMESLKSKIQKFIFLDGLWF